ncbi:MAG: PAS domain S-box protein [Deltaproteobacteria bacterium]
MTAKQPEIPQELRQRAEEKFSADETDSLQTPAPEEAKKLLHDLRVHQIELEMQNEELRKKQDELDASRSRYFDLYDLAPVGYLTVSDEGLILKTNLAAAIMLGVDRNYPFHKSMSRFIFPEDQDVYYLYRKQLIDSGELQNWEMRLKRVDGSYFWAELQSVLAQNGENWIILKDITDRKQAEEKLRESEELFKNMFQKHSAMMLLVEPNSGDIVDANYAAAEFYGYSKDKLLTLNIAVINRLNPDLVECERRKAFHEEKSYFVFPHKLSSGEIRTVEVHSTPIVINDKPQLFSIIHDITERKQAEEALIESEFRWKFALEGAGDGVWDWNVQTGEAFYSPRYKEMLGFAENEIGNTSEEWLKRIHPEDAPGVMTALKPYLDGKTGTARVEFRMLCKDGSWKWIVGRGMVVSLDSDGKPLRMIGTNTDITDRKQREAYLELSRKALQILNEPGDVPDTIRHILAELKAGTGFDAVGISLQSGDDFPYLYSLGFSADFLQKENSLLARDSDGGVCRNSDGSVCLECTCGLVIMGKIDPTNPLFTRGGSCWTNDSPQLLGIPADMDPRLHPRNECIHQNYNSVALVPIRNKEKIVGLLHFNDRRTGRFTLDIVEILEGVATNIGAALMRKQAEEEFKKLEQQLRQSQKLESLGVLSGGIAHDFNNILAIIIGYCGLTMMDYETAENNIPEIEKAAERAAALCRQMLAYAGKAQLAKSQVNFCALVGEMLELLKSTLPQNAMIKSDLSTDIPVIDADASQLSQVVMNLIINASEAIGNEQGEIQVSLANATVIAGQSDKDYNGKAIPPGGYILLSVTDNGCGMDEETKWRIFEPFYTTKFTGRGLGMSAVLGIIKSHGGALQLFSQIGHGSTFKVYLPVSTTGITVGEDQTASAPSAPWRGSGTILLVEDEDEVRHIAKALLKNFGFTVLEAVNGKEGLELYQKNASEISLVLTDMGMPVMDGYEMFHKLKSLNPELPIIISSGYGDTEVSSRIGSDNIAGLISKPYNPDQLREVLKRVVGGCFVEKT